MSSSVVSQAALGQTPDERLRKQFPWMRLLSRSSSSLAAALSSSLRGRIASLRLPSNVSLSYIGARAHTQSDKSSPSAKKSINKCIVSSLSAVGISLSKLSEKAVECEIEFRTVRRVRGHKMSVCLLIYSYCSSSFCKWRVS